MHTLIYTFIEQVKIKSPKNTVSTLLPVRSSDILSAGFTNWPFMSVHFWGENPSGDWEFEVDNGNINGMYRL